MNDRPVVAACSPAGRKDNPPQDLCPLDDEDSKGEVIELEEHEEDCAPIRLAPEPGEPTDEQVEVHRTSHLPYRSWCETCVEGRGSGEQHRSGPGSNVPVVACDYLIVTKRGIYRRTESVEASEMLLKILVVKDAKSKYIGAHVVPVKGPGEDRYAAEKLRRDILWLGYSRVILRADNEPAIVAVVAEALKGLKVDVVDQAASSAPPAYDSKANGSIEHAVRLVQGLLRTLKLCLERRLLHSIPADHAIMAWLVQHTAWLLTVQSRGQDGFTAYERLRGKPWSRRMACFGETCLAKLHKGDIGKEEVPKLAARWCRAVLLGYDRDTNEYILTRSAPF